MVLQVLSLLDFQMNLAEMIVNDGAIKSVKLIQGDSSVVDARNEQLTGDPEQEYLVSLALALNCCLFLEKIFRMKKYLVLATLPQDEDHLGET